MVTFEHIMRKTIYVYVYVYIYIYIYIKFDNPYRVIVIGCRWGVSLTIGL